MHREGLVMKAKMITFHVPKDQELLAAFGEVALRHEHMNHILKMTIKSLADLTPTEALAATMHESTRQLRDRIRKLAKKRLGEGKPLLKLQAMVSACKKLTDKRNELVHGLWARELDGDAHVRDACGSVRPLPTVQELRQLAKDIEELTNRLNFERLQGFLKLALSEGGDSCQTKS
jgi:hypothetical protein